MYDLILRYRFYIVAAETLHIHNCLAAAQECPISEIHLAYSHPQPLAQCSNFIAQYRFQTVPCSATAAAAQKVAKERTPGTFSRKDGRFGNVVYNPQQVRKG